MRIPVFARRANPRVDRPILKKSHTYAASQVEAGLADWIDPTDLRKGIVCREMLNRERPPQFEPETGTCSSDRALGVKFIGPPNPIPHFRSDLGRGGGWDWSIDLLRLSPDPRSPLAAAVLPTQNSAYDSGELPL